MCISGLLGTGHARDHSKSSKAAPLEKALEHLVKGELQHSACTVQGCMCQHITSKSEDVPGSAAGRW